MERSLPRVRFCVGRTLFSQTLTWMRQTWVVCSNGKNPTTRRRWLLRGGVVGGFGRVFLGGVRVRLKFNMSQCGFISGKYFKQVHGNLSRNMLDEVIENDVFFGFAMMDLASICWEGAFLISQMMAPVPVTGYPL